MWSSEPRAWLGGVEFRAAGSHQHAKATIRPATIAYSRRISEQDLEMADTSVVATSSGDMSNDICAQIK
eukprot:8412936-Pyramimonas_sp.AAC.1